MPARFETLSEHRCFGGRQMFCRHQSQQIGLPMRFGIFLPPREPDAEVPVVMFLAGLTCNEETFAIKAGAQRSAAELGIALLTPDTSPRGARVSGEADSWDFGVAAGFYLDATREPWATHWRMESYLLQELLPMAVNAFALDPSSVSLCGHSMGGHGALTLALRHPARFVSVSAFAPIAAPVRAPWGRKAFTGYLGEDEAQWVEHDATELMARQSSAPFPQGILVDQGSADQYLAEQLYPEAFADACRKVGQPLTLRYHHGYDHGYYFISTFIDEHLRFHHLRMKR